MESGNDQINIRLEKRAKLELAQATYRRFRIRCFWFQRVDLQIGEADLGWLAEGLRRHGGRDGFLLADELCR